MRQLDEVKVLHVDLNNKKHWIERFPTEYMKNFLGARGIASYILYRDVRKGIDPLGNENVLIFAPGILTGTCLPTAGRTTVIGKSPVTGMFMKANMGGCWGAEFKYTGNDILVIHGIADRLTNLFITDTGVVFMDANEYKGLDVRKTTDKFAKEVGIENPAVACIGPAGEKLVKFAGIMCDIYHTAARGGLGAVMGSKNLKAIGVHGKIGISIKDKEKFLAVCDEATKSIDSTGRVHFYKEYGTAGVIMSVNETKALPSKNFQIGSLDNAYDISGQCMTEKEYLVRRESCFACNISCKRYSKTKQSYIGSEAGGPEYETLGAFGAGCLVIDMDANLRANELCNILGLDSISTGSVIQWAMETAEKGLLPEEFKDPLTGIQYKLKWGDKDAMLILIEMISDRRGLGDLLAEGVKHASEVVGGDSWKWAVHAKGLEQSRVETRNAKAYALAFALNPRGPDHLYGQPMAEFGFSPEARKLVKEITGDEKYANPYIVDKKPEIVAWHENSFAMTDCLGICIRATLSTYAITPRMMKDFFEYGVGITMSEQEFVTAAERIINIERSFNIREGADRTFDTLPWRIMNEELEGPDEEKMIVSAEELGKMLDQYYQLRGWDSNGKPTVDTLNSLGLGIVTEDLI